MSGRTPVASKSLGIFTLGLALFTCPPLAAELCKWTDEHGTVHYAEQCPEGVDGEGVEIEDAPSAASIEAAEARSRELVEAREAREAEASQPVKKSADELGIEAVDRAMACARAMREARVLSVQVPSYYDEDGTLQHDLSMFSMTYKGTRAYISDEERPTVLRDVRLRIQSQCGSSERDLALQRYASAALLFGDVCVGWKTRARNLLHSDNPGSREMAHWLRERCR